MKKAIFLLTIIAFGGHSLEAQGIFKKIGNATKDKFSKKAEKIIVDEISDYAADQATKPLQKTADDYLKDSYEQSTGEKYDTTDIEKSSKALNEYLALMSKDVEYEDSYRFDARVDIELKDYGSNRSDLLSILTSTKGFYGLQQDNNGHITIMIIDENNNAMISYDQSKNRAMALPYDQRRFGASLQQTPSDQTHTADMKMPNIEKLKKTKKVLGFTSYGYRYDDKEYRSDMYLSGTFPINWASAFGGTFQKYASNFYRENSTIDLTENMIMYGETTRKSDGKKSTWEVVNLDENPPEIKTTDMNFETLYSPK